MSAFAARAATLADLPVVLGGRRPIRCLSASARAVSADRGPAGRAFAARELNTVLLADGAPVAFANCYRHTGRVRDDRQCDCGAGLARSRAARAC